MEQRFRDGMDVNPVTGCWEWRSARDRSVHAYGPHRRAYELWVGPIPPNMEIDHRCHVRACINPEHLRAVTHRENMQNTKRGVEARKRAWPSTEARQQAKAEAKLRAERESRENVRRIAEQIAAQYPHLADTARKYRD